MNLIELAIIQVITSVEDEQSPFCLCEIQIAETFGRAFEHCHMHVRT
jgi:hypothetical protein